MMNQYCVKASRRPLGSCRRHKVYYMADGQLEKNKLISFKFARDFIAAITRMTKVVMRQSRGK